MSFVTSAKMQAVERVTEDISVNHFGYAIPTGDENLPTVV